MAQTLNICGDWNLLNLVLDYCVNTYSYIQENNVREKKSYL